MDLARCSDLVTDSMSALGLEVSDLAGYLDVAARANNKSNQTAEQLMEAYIGVGGTLRGLNVPIRGRSRRPGQPGHQGLRGRERPQRRHDKPHHRSGTGRKDDVEARHLRL